MNTLRKPGRERKIQRKKALLSKNSRAKLTYLT